MKKAETTPAEGWAQMMIEGQLVTFDTTRFRPIGAERAVLVHMDGRITVEPIDRQDASVRLGPRGAMEMAKPSGPRGRIESGAVVVLGVVVE